MTERDQGEQEPKDRRRDSEERRRLKDQVAHGATRNIGRGPQYPFIRQAVRLKSQMGAFCSTSVF
jgi:hypothetical protein